MSNPFKKEMEKIAIPTELSERSKRGILQAKSELPKRNYIWMKSVIAVASVILVVGVTFIFNGGTLLNDKYDQASDPESSQPESGNNHAIAPEHEQFIYTMEKPISKNDNIDLDRYIFYNDIAYIQHESFTMDTDVALRNKGEEIGYIVKTLNDNGVEIVQVVEGEQLNNFSHLDILGKVFSVVDYEPQHIILIEKTDNTIQLYQARKKVRIIKGRNVFDKINLFYNIDYITTSNNKVVDNRQLLDHFSQRITNAPPAFFEGMSTENSIVEQDERLIVLHLKNGAKIQLMIHEDGYVRYKLDNIYFKINPEFFQEFWKELYSL